MRIVFDPAKRAKTLAERGLDFADAGHVFAGLHFTRADDRRAYGERRYITAGWLRGRLIVLVWTPRGTARRIISMRHANDREKALFEKNLG
ncbi:MAG: BrnT family toxin [Rhodospirillales bacterium]|nr:BrnT family toxin [Rhodospirillales bacterium]